MFFISRFEYAYLLFHFLKFYTTIAYDYSLKLTFRISYFRCSIAPNLSLNMLMNAVLLFRGITPSEP